MSQQDSRSLFLSVIRLYRMNLVKTAANLVDEKLIGFIGEALKPLGYRKNVLFFEREDGI